MHDGLLPVTALVRRELLRHLRRRRVIASVVLLGCIMVWVVWNSWPMEVMVPAGLRQIATNLSSQLAGLYILATLLVLPGYAAMSIRSEHDTDTYELMRLTLLTPLSIMIGTLANVIGLFLFTLVATLPIFLLAYLIAPLPWWNALLKITIVMCTALACASAGLFASTLRRKTSDVIGSAYGFAAATVLPAFVVPAILVLGAGGGIIRAQIWIVVLLAAFSAVFLNVSVNKLRHFSYERISELPPPLPVMPFRGMRVRDTARRPRMAYPDGRNPVFVREFGDALQRAQINWGSLLATVVLSAGLFAMTLLITLSGGFVQGAWGAESPHDVLRWYFVTTMLIAACTIPGISTPAWTNDRNTEMEEALDLTLLTRRQRFVGRACAAAALPFIVMACWAVGFSPLLSAAFATPGGVVVALIGATGVAALLFNLLALGRRIARMPLSTPTAVVLVHLVTAAYLGLPYAALPHSSNTASIADSVLAAIGPISAVICAARSAGRGHSGIALPIYWMIFALVQAIIFAIFAWGDLRSERSKWSRTI